MAADRSLERRGSEHSPRRSLRPPKRAERRCRAPRPLPSPLPRRSSPLLPEPKPPPPAKKPTPKPEDEAIIENLELFMLMEMLKDYEILRETEK